jgi:hypothetical protein
MFGMNKHNFAVQHHKASNTLQVLDTQSGEIFAKVLVEQGAAAALQLALDYAQEKHNESWREKDLAYWNGLAEFCIAILEGLA